MADKKIRLKVATATDVRRTLARITNMVANNEIDTKKANTIILACNAVLSAIRTDDQQKKISELEQLLKEITNGR
ncbi:hypothetical protein [Anaerosporobacter faecicola]|uniref:hypothetical protein n=1 Tax=Anaerosporobacter faecicola TaxID=2718714 RepID=UPI001438B75B|nr:hypothetical protein [Anaerosporobacter faecicola]